MNPPVVEKISVRYQDLDPYGHVNNAVHLQLFEAARIAYLETLVEMHGIGPLVSGDIPGVRYIVAEATVRYKAPIYFEDALFCTANVRTVGNRSFAIDHELRAGESFETGRLVAEGSSAEVFYDPETEEVQSRPEWFLSAVAKLEGRTEVLCLAESLRSGLRRYGKRLSRGRRLRWNTRRSKGRRSPRWAWAPGGSPARSAGGASSAPWL